MAWSAPPTWVISEVVTAARLQILSDDLAYLKGTSAAVQIDNDLSTSHVGGSTLTAEGTGNTSFGRFRFLAKRTSGAVVDWRLMCNAISDVGELAFYDGTAAAERMRLDASGNLGIGTAAPASRLHASGPGGGGWLFFSADNVTTLQTPIVAGTIVSGCAMWLFDRNNNTGTGSLGFNGQAFSLGSAPTYVNSDTITVTLTAGGAITVQRTTGTNGSHDINAIVLFF